MARSSIGEGYRSFKAERWVRFPYGLLHRVQVQMEARLLWEQEVLGSTPRCLTLEGSRGLVAPVVLIRPPR
jgi:hypothetical protein